MYFPLPFHAIVTTDCRPWVYHLRLCILLRGHVHPGLLQIPINYEIEIFYAIDVDRELICTGSLVNHLTLNITHYFEKY